MLNGGRLSLVPNDAEMIMNWATEPDSSVSSIMELGETTLH
jgi:hypothetical protein